MRLNSRVSVYAWRALLAGMNGGSSGLLPLPFTSLFVDPQDSTGHATDAGPGTSGTPLLTTLEANRRLIGALTATTSIQYLSDDMSGDGLDLSRLSLNNFNLNVIAPQVLLHTGGQLNAGTVVINPTAGGGGQRQTAHTTDLATFNPYVFVGQGGAAVDPVLLVNTNTNDRAWVMSGVATASLSQPVSADTLSAGTMPIGAPYKLVRGGLLTLAATPAPSTTTGVVTFDGFTFTSNSVGPFGPAGSTPAGSERIVFRNCALLGPVLIPAFYSNCFACSGGQGAFNSFISAGAYLAVDQDTGIFTFENAVYIPGNMIVGGGFLNSAFFAPGSISNSAAQFQDDAVNVAPLIIAEGAQVTMTGLVWGNGNANSGVVVAAGGDLVVQVGVTPSVTGTSDFGFLDTTGVHLVARAFDDTTGAYTEAGGVATRATTWAHLTASIGAGGFGGGAHWPSADAHVVTATI